MDIESLVLDNKGLVYHIVDKYFYNYYKNDNERDDLIAEGMVYLVKAAKRYKENKGYETITVD